ncbi:TPA: DEAD/DEAH box helicase family protein [Providencia rettgeri]|nr:DEAD/DEAH box helicase family protein [Providencia rettgeri]
MDRIKEASYIIKAINDFKNKKISEPDFISEVCGYFDKVKKLDLTISDMKFLKYISNLCGVPHYYDLLFSKFGQVNGFVSYNLDTLSANIYESTLHIDENIKIHEYQKRVLSKFTVGRENRFFLSATTSFGKTFLIYEVIKKMGYKNIVLIFPTIALLSENYERLVLSSMYSYFKDNFSIHTLSDMNKISERNIFIFTPERYLSFIDKQKEVNLDFVFVDEIYKIDNEFMIDATNVENERDTAYRVALQSLLAKCQDIFLVGPYIDFPSKFNIDANQSFNIFLEKKRFELIDYNKYEIVNKKHLVIENKKNRIDSELTIDLKGFSGLKRNAKISKIVKDIRKINENVILYSKGPGFAESYAKGIIENGNEIKLNEELNLFISHLSNSYKYSDWIIIKALKQKVGIHHGLVPKYIQKEIVDFFNKGYLDVLVSTTTITEGVNTSAKNLLVLNSTKGNKDLKKFDAKNVAGRAGRFLYHYSGRVLILDKKFNEILNSDNDDIKHKNFDSTSVKNEVDYFITDDDYLNSTDIAERERILLEQKERNIPDEIMSMYKVISHSDKFILHDNILLLSPEKHLMINKLISMINKGVSIDYDGLQVVFEVIKPIVKNNDLFFLLDNETKLKKGINAGKYYCTLVYSLSAYLSEGFGGVVSYYLKRNKKIKKDEFGNEVLEKYTIDEAIRLSSKFIFSTLKYQLVKYLGVFNVMYKYYRSITENINFSDVFGIEKLLVKLEYNAISEKGRLASDYGVPSKIIEFYDNGESKKGIRDFDDYEKTKFLLIESILSENIKFSK